MIETAVTAGLVAAIIVAVVCRICWRRSERCSAQDSASRLELRIGDDVKLSWTRSKKASEAPRHNDAPTCVVAPMDGHCAPQRT